MKKIFIVTMIVFITISSYSQERQFNRANKRNTVEAYNKFIEKFPISEYTEKAFFKRAVLINTIFGFEFYLNKYPKGYYTDSAQIKINQLILISARVVVDFPPSIKGSVSPYSNVSSPFFKWHVTFKETGGNVGYTIKGQGWYYDNNGKAYGSSAYSGNTTEEIIVNPGESYTYNTWFSGKSFIGGYVLMNFTGKDERGNPININVHIDCK